MFKRLFSIFNQVNSAPVIPSCFVKGLIRSIQEHPQEWRVDESWLGSDTFWKHPSGITISYWSRWTPSRVHIIGHKITEAENGLLTSVVWEALEKPRRAPIDEAIAKARAAEEVKLAAERAVFEKLGCPDSSIPSTQ